MAQPSKDCGRTCSRRHRDERSRPPRGMTVRSLSLYTSPMSEPFDVDALDDTEPFEIDRQAAHLFKHPHLGLDDVMDA